MLLIPVPIFVYDGPMDSFSGPIRFVGNIVNSTATKKSHHVDL